MSLQALREKRAAQAKALNDLLEANPDKWDDTLQATWDTGMKEIDSIDASIGRITSLNEKAAAQRVDEQLIEAADRAGKDNPSPSSALLNKWMRGGDNALTAEDWQSIRATMSTTTPSEGGYSVQKDVAKVIVEALKAFGGVRASGATIISTDQGNPMDFPNSDGTSETGEQLAENADATGADPVLGVTNLATYKYSSKVVAVPIELLQDSAVDIEAFVRSRLVTRIGRITNTKFTTGTGTNEPKGVVVAASAGKVGTTGQTTTVIYDDLIDLQHAVDPSYRAMNPKFMMNDAMLKVIRKLKDGQNRPIFVPGYEMNSPGGFPDTLLGAEIVINQDMAVPAANAKSILYGEFSPYIIRDVMALTLYRFDDSAYAKKGQVGFLMLSRHGGNFTDVGNSLKYYQNSAT